MRNGQYCSGMFRVVVQYVIVKLPVKTDNYFDSSVYGTSCIHEH